MLTSKDIIEIFSYDQEEQELFPYIARYMKLVTKKLPEIEKDVEKLRKFALAGLFLTYRVFNNTGRTMTTEFKEPPPETGDFKKLLAFKEYFGIEIIDTDHYFSMINYSFVDFILMALRLRKISKKLYKFVVS